MLETFRVSCYLLNPKSRSVDQEINGCVYCLFIVYSPRPSVFFYQSTFHPFPLGYSFFHIFLLENFKSGERRLFLIGATNQPTSNQPTNQPHPFVSLPIHFSFKSLFSPDFRLQSEPHSQVKGYVLAVMSPEIVYNI